jgi:hypothetical protein
MSSIAIGKSEHVPVAWLRQAVACPCCRLHVFLGLVVNAAAGVFQKHDATSLGVGDGKNFSTVESEQRRIKNKRLTVNVGPRLLTFWNEICMKGRNIDKIFQPCVVGKRYRFELLDGWKRSRGAAMFALRHDLEVCLYHGSSHCCCCCC